MNHLHDFSLYGILFVGKFYLSIWIIFNVKILKIKFVLFVYTLFVGRHSVCLLHYWVPTTQYSPSNVLET